MIDTRLMHHGVLGMHWGVRRYRNKDGSLTEAGKAHAKKSADRKASREKKKERLRDAKNVRNLSDEELLERIGRLEKEQKLVDLTIKNTRGLKTGHSATHDVLVGAGKKVATAAVAGAAAYVGKAYISSAFGEGVFDLSKPAYVRVAEQMFETNSFDPGQAAAYMFPNPNKKK